MRQEAEFFGDRELDLIYIGKRLSDAQSLETLLTEAGWDYYVEPDLYRGGIIFATERTGAFFYVDAARASDARTFLEQHGYRPQPPLPAKADDSAAE